MHIEKESYHRFDSEWYLKNYSDVAASGMDPAEHYARFGKKEGRFPNGQVERAHRSAAMLDANWYMERYPDVVGTGLEAAAHYLQVGAQEGRHTNADDEKRQAQVDVFDPVWYLARNRDVAKSGMDPLQHFREYGFFEGRSPNEASEPRSYWINWFDPVWYTARYLDVDQTGLAPLEHYLKKGIYEGRAANTAEEDRGLWSDTFDEKWYADRYLDVRSSGLLPLEHFIQYGIISRRKPNAETILDHTSVDEARLNCLKDGELSADVALFVSHSPTGKLKPHLRAHLAAIKNADVSIILIVATDAKKIVIPSEIYDLANVIYTRENFGYDFAAWAHILRERPEIYIGRSAYLLNDSTIGPFDVGDFKNLLQDIENTDADIVGLTDNHQLGWHLQSYFLALKQRALKSHALHEFFNRVVAYKYKIDVINEYETQFASEMIGEGLRCEAIFRSVDHTNYTLYRWRELIDRGFPYLKASILCRLVTRIDIAGWRERLRSRGYDARVADATLAEIAAAAQSQDQLDSINSPFSSKKLITEMHQFFSQGGTIRIHREASPVFSVAIIVANHAEYLFEILRRFEFFGQFASVEVIIVDYGSTDDTQFLLSNVSNVEIVRVRGGMRYADGICAALSTARGKYLLFLNGASFLADSFFEKTMNIFRTLESTELVAGKRSETSKGGVFADGLGEHDIYVASAASRSEEDYFCFLHVKSASDVLRNRNLSQIFSLADCVREIGLSLGNDMIRECRQISVCVY
ncbi:rhamnan synthesis F family protein [Methylobacterium fujisawaense]|uniref:rhamnan synthesis F family protein n=1 Tax=Methylobacterium fujisawaense TaxID=107400 RepID=UPI0031F55B0D